MATTPPGNPADHTPTHASPAGEPPPAVGVPALRVLVAYGATREPIDDVRFIGNRSSGRMGAAIADAFARAGCQVTAVASPGAEVPNACAAVASAGAGAPNASAAASGAHRLVHSETAADLLQVLRAEWPHHDMLVMAAAVADFRPARAAPGKLRRESGPLRLDLEPTEDILAGLADTTGPRQFVVGFALERPDELAASAQAKLTRKRVDAIVANPLATMGAPDVDMQVLLADGTWLRPTPPGPLPKVRAAEWLVGVLLPRAVERARRAPRT